MTPCSQFLYLEDENGIVWQIGVDDNGMLFSMQSIGSPTVPTPVFLDGQGGFWQLGVSNGMLFDQKIAPFPVNLQTWQNTFPLVTPGGYLLYLTVDSDGLLITYNTQTQAINYVEGELLQPPEEGYPAFTQPGGIGTPTFPAQPSGEDGPVPDPAHPGSFLQPWTAGIPDELGQAMWVSGCGHWFNHWEVKEIASCGVQVGLMCCPLCGFIQRIISPYSAIQSDANYILVA
jgi:hypothetical protein